MYGIVVPGKVGSMTVRFPSARTALEKYREMVAEGRSSIDVTDAKGEPVTVDDLERAAKEAGDAEGN